ncbi:hypothetical protein D3C75_1160620 [compost metagenome]
MAEQGLRVDVRDDGEHVADGIGAVRVAQSSTDETFGDLGEFGQFDVIVGWKVC